MSSLSRLSVRAFGRSKIFSSASSAAPMMATTVTTARDSSASSFCHKTVPTLMALKAGSPIPGLDVIKDKEAAIALERREYPTFVDRLATPLPTLANLRRMPEEDADDRLKMRYLKLKRRMIIKENNQGMAK